MFKNYFTVAIRNLLKHKAYTFINVIGLVIGLTCSTLILLYLQYEFSYDRHHSKADRIHRILQTNRESNGDVSYRYGIRSTAAPGLAEEFPEVERATSFIYRAVDIGIEGKESLKGFVTVADAEFFQVFDFPMVQGDVQAGLQTPFSIFITQRLAKTLFGDGDPIGQTVLLDSKLFGDRYTISGILKDMPKTSASDLAPDLITATRPRKSDDIDAIWEWWPIFFSYVLLEPNASISTLEAKFPDFVQRHSNVPASEITWGYKSMPLTDMHLHGGQYNLLGEFGDINSCYALGLIGIVIVVVACINFMNLSTARSARRMREVGMRKVVGARRMQLVYQFLCESVLLSLVAFVFALGLTYMLLPLLNEFMQIQISLNMAIVPLLALLGMGVGILAGSYPAFFLSSFRPIMALRAMRNTKGGHASVRKGLVVVQFAISVVLIVGTLIVFEQMAYLRTANLGFNKDALITISGISRNAVTMKQQFQQVVGVKNVTITQLPLLGKLIDGDSFHLKSTNANIPIRTNYIMTDPDFLNTYEVPFISGRQWTMQDLSTIPRSGNILDVDRNILLNETAAKKLDVQVGDIIKSPFSPDITLSVVGIFKDFHHISLHHTIRPLMLLPVINERQCHITVRFNMQNVSEVLANLEKAWKMFEPDRSFVFEFMDEARAEFYHREQRLSRIYALSTGLAIVIACLGLLGLIAYTAEVRTKEIGVRKVLGATEGSIVRLLTKEFLVLVALASVLAYPVAYYTMSSWLQNFAYRIDLSVVYFVVSTGVTLIVTLLTIAYQALKAARTNPIDALRYE